MNDIQKRIFKDSKVCMICRTNLTDDAVFVYLEGSPTGMACPKCAPNIRGCTLMLSVHEAKRHHAADMVRLYKGKAERIEAARQEVPPSLKQKLEEAEALLASLEATSHVVRVSEPDVENGSTQ